MSKRAVLPNRPTDELLVRAQLALGLSHRRFGEAIGISERTSQRWVGTTSKPTIRQLCTLAALVYPRDAALASMLAEAASETLESLGIAPPPPPAVAPAPTPAPLAPHLVADLVVCAAASAGGIVPSAARAAVSALFVRMRELGLSVEDVEAALAASAATPQGSNVSRSVSR
jgi:hypothetical protein